MIPAFRAGTHIVKRSPTVCATIAGTMAAEVLPEGKNCIYDKKEIAEEIQCGDGEE